MIFIMGPWNQPSPLINILEPVKKCRCPCHRSKVVVHVKPCCDICPHCGKPLKEGYVLHSMICSVLSIFGQKLG